MKDVQLWTNTNQKGENIQEDLKRGRADQLYEFEFERRHAMLTKKNKKKNQFLKQ